MYIGSSIFLIALGAILKFAVTATVAGIDLQAAGIILMVVGVMGLVISLALMTVWSDRRRGADVVERDRVVERDPVVERDRQYSPNARLRPSQGGYLSPA